MTDPVFVVETSTSIAFSSAMQAKISFDTTSVQPMLLSKAATLLACPAGRG
jgi:hypothetical protein